MNFLLDAGLGILALAALGAGARIAADKVVQSAYIHALRAKNAADYVRAKDLFGKANQLATALYGRKSTLASDARLLLCWVEIEQGHSANALNLLTVSSSGFYGLSPLTTTAWAFVQQNDMTNGERLLVEMLGRSQPGTLQHASALCALGWIRIQQMRLTEARNMLQTSLVTLEHLFGVGSKYCVPAAQHLAWLNLLQERWQDAIQLAHFSVRVYERKLGSNHPRTANAVLLRAVVAIALGEDELVAADLKRAERIFKICRIRDKPAVKCVQIAKKHIQSVDKVSTTAAQTKTPEGLVPVDRSGADAWMI